MFLFFYCLILIAPFFVLKIKDLFQPEFVVNAYFIIFIALGPLAMMLVSPYMFHSGEYEFVTELTLLGYVSINIGFFLASLSFSGVDNKNFNFENSFNDKGWIFISKILLIISFISIILFFIRAGQIPIFSENKEAARVEALSVGGNGYLLYLSTLGMTAILLYSGVQYWKCFLKKIKPKKTILILAFFVGSILAGTGSRRYFFWTFLYVFIAYHYLYKPLNVKYLIFFGFLAFLGVNFFEMYRNQGSDTTVDFLTTSYYRLIVYFYNLEAAFSAFKKSDLMWGSTLFMDVMTILPGKQIDYQSWVKIVTGLEFEGFGVPPTIMGDMYINFGVPGVFLGCLIFGFILKLFYFYKTSLKFRTPISILIYALILEISIRTLTSGVSAQTMGLLWISVVYSSLFVVQKIICRI